MKRLALLCLALVACRATPVGPYATPDALVRDSAQAERLTRQASEVVGGNAAQAETLLRQALTADLYHGPAHNNLGVLLLNQGKLYEASIEFEWARKLMPSNPDPRVNLALTLERAGRVGEAIDTYRAALEVAPEDIAATQGIASLTVRTGSQNAALDGWLKTITLRGEDERWRAWARQRLE